MNWCFRSLWRPNFGEGSWLFALFKASDCLAFSLTREKHAQTVINPLTEPFLASPEQRIPAHKNNNDRKRVPPCPECILSRTHAIMRPIMHASRAQKHRILNVIKPIVSGHICWEFSWGTIDSATSFIYYIWKFFLLPLIMAWVKIKENAPAMRVVSELLEGKRGDIYQPNFSYQINLWWNFTDISSTS